MQMNSYELVEYGFYMVILWLEYVLGFTPNFPTALNIKGSEKIVEQSLKSLPRYTTGF